MNAFEQHLGDVLGPLRVSFVGTRPETLHASYDGLGTIKTNLLARWMWRLGLTQLHTVEDASELVYRTLLLDESPSAMNHLTSYDVFMVAEFQSLPIVYSLSDLVTRMGMKIGEDGEEALDRASFDGGLTRMMEFDLWVGAMAMKHGIAIVFQLGSKDEGRFANELTDEEALQTSVDLLDRERTADSAFWHTRQFYERLGNV